MNEQKEKILKRIDELIDKRRGELLKSFTFIHELNDGIVLRSFNEWSNCSDDKDVKYIVIPNRNEVDEIVLLNFIPKGTKLERKNYSHIQCITMLSGKMELNIGEETVLINSYSKIVLENGEFGCVALEDTYTVTSNKK